MASAVCRIEDVEQGDVPAISVKTGEPCENPAAIPLRVGRTVLSPGGRKVLAVVPLEARRVRRHHLLTRASWIVLMLFAASLAASFAVGIWPSFVFLVAYAALVFGGDAGWINCRAAANDDEIVLTKVHAGFARAVEAQYT